MTQILISIEVRADDLIAILVAHLGEGASDKERFLGELLSQRIQEQMNFLLHCEATKSIGGPAGLVAEAVAGEHKKFRGGQPL